MRKTLFLIFASSLANCFAQPTFTAQQITPTIGEKFTFVNFSNGDAGNGGNNKTWSFSTSSLLVQDTAQVKVLAPSKTPFANKFATADIALSYDSVEFEFFKTGAVYTQLGLGYNDPPTNESIVFSNSKEELRFPLSISTNFSDTYSAQTTQIGFSFKQTGNVRVFADGWGTITTPDGTYQNALRLVEIDSSTSIYSSFGESDTTRELIKRYKWFVADIHFPVFEIDSTFDEEGEAYISGNFLLRNTVSNIENLKLFSFQVFPNPASNFVTIETPQATEITITVFDVLGKEIIRQNSTSKQTNLSLESLSAGNYLVRVLDVKTKEFAERKIVKQ